MRLVWVTVYLDTLMDFWEHESPEAKEALDVLGYDDNLIEIGVREDDLREYVMSDEPNEEDWKIFCTEYREDYMDSLADWLYSKGKHCYSDCKELVVASNEMLGNTLLYIEDPDEKIFPEQLKEDGI